jgi:DNA-directed RNA polymerase subunit K/omega
MFAKNIAERNKIDLYLKIMDDYNNRKKKDEIMSDIEDNEKYSSDEEEDSVVQDDDVDVDDEIDDVDVDEDDVEEADEEAEDVEDADDESVNDNSQVHQLETTGGASDGDSDNEEDEDEDEDDLLCLQKFNAEVNKNYLANAHPECVANNYDEIVTLTKVVRDGQNNIIDPLHRTLPYLTKYERTRVLGQRAKQINSGSTVFVKVPENMIDGHLIAEIELVQKRIPFILRRPIPGGGCEYWNLKDLEIVGF